MAVKRVVMQLNITHTWDSDLWIKLTSPNNTTLTMSKSNGSLYENYTNTIFNSACATPITSGSAPFNGCYSPEQAMAGFNNQTVKGTWTLTVTDQSIYDTGTLNTWTLAMCVQ
jgi:subtilisin-like proprotein convertase family protein